MTYTGEHAREAPADRDRLAGYDRFEILIRLKFGLGRVLHESPPAYRPVLKRTLDGIDEKLGGFDNYADLLREYALRNRTVG